uniref:Zinc finger and BTB domain containing 16b n=1 Tax=Mola mola TaxID=94237 RepID=A0A3Q3VIR2_MOLML
FVHLSVILWFSKTTQVKSDALRRSGSLCDALISVKSQTFRAHRLVLACASRRLAQQLALGDLNDPVHCTLECFSPHTFQQVLDFTYTQTLEVSVDDLHLLLRAAQLLEMQPLEDQCRMQLHKLRCSAREEDEKREIIHLKEEKESPEQTEQKLNESPIGKEKLGEASTPVEPCNSIVMENISNAAKDSNGAQSPRKKARVSPESRESVITWPAGSRTPLSSPWAFPNMWKSVRTLRQLAENYPSLVPVHPLQSPNQSSLTHPFSFTTPHMFPLFGEKPFECRSCGQRSRDYSAMIKHLRTHGGALPYQCTVCLEFCSSLVAIKHEFLHKYQNANE